MNPDILHENRTFKLLLAGEPVSIKDLNDVLALAVRPEHKSFLIAMEKEVGGLGATRNSLSILKYLYICGHKEPAVQDILVNRIDKTIQVLTLSGLSKTLGRSFLGANEKPITTREAMSQVTSVFEEIRDKLGMDNYWFEPL